LLERRWPTFFRRPFTSTRKGVRHPLSGASNPRRLAPDGTSYFFLALPARISLAEFAKTASSDRPRRHCRFLSADFRTHGTRRDTKEFLRVNDIIPLLICWARPSMDYLKFYSRGENFTCESGGLSRLLIPTSILLPLLAPYFREKVVSLAKHSGDKLKWRDWGRPVKSKRIISLRKCNESIRSPMEFPKHRHLFPRSKSSYRAFRRGKGHNSNSRRIWFR